MTSKTDNSDSARLRRVEFRLSNFMRWLGYDPTREIDVELNSKVTEANGRLYASTPLVTVGDLCQAVYRNKLSGDVPVYLNGVQVATFNVTRNFQGG